MAFAFSLHKYFISVAAHVDRWIDGKQKCIVYTNTYVLFSLQLPFCGFGSSPSTTCPPESLEDKENASPAKCLFRDTDRIHCSSPLAEKKPTFLVGAEDTNSQVCRMFGLSFFERPILDHEIHLQNL